MLGSINHWEAWYQTSQRLNIDASDVNATDIECHVLHGKGNISRLLANKLFTAVCGFSTPRPVLVVFI